MTTEDTASEDAVTMDRLARVYIKMRDKRAEMTAAFEKEDAAIKEQQEEVANAMKDILHKTGGESMRTQYGTVALKTNTRYYVQDWDAMSQFIIDNQAVYLLEKRVAQRNMSEFLESNPGVAPPSLNTMSEVTVSVTKPRKG